MGNYKNAYRDSFPFCVLSFFPSHLPLLVQMLHNIWRSLLELCSYKNNCCNEMRQPFHRSLNVIKETQGWIVVIMLNKTVRESSNA